MCPIDPVNLCAYLVAQQDRTTLLRVGCAQLRVMSLQVAALSSRPRGAVLL